MSDFVSLYALPEEEHIIHSSMLSLIEGSVNGAWKVMVTGVGQVLAIDCVR